MSDTKTENPPQPQPTEAASRAWMGYAFGAVVVAGLAGSYPYWNQHIAPYTPAALKPYLGMSSSLPLPTDEPAQSENAVEEENASISEAIAEDVTQKEITLINEKLDQLTFALSLPDELAEQAEEIRRLEKTVEALKAQLGEMVLREREYTQPFKDMKAWWLVQRMQRLYETDNAWQAIITQFLGHYLPLTAAEQEVMQRMERWSMEPPLSAAELKEKLNTLYLAEQPDAGNAAGAWQQFKFSLTHLIKVRRIAPEDATSPSQLHTDELLASAIDAMEKQHVAKALSLVERIKQPNEAQTSWINAAKQYLAVGKDLTFLNNSLISRQSSATAASAVPQEGDAQ